MERDLIYFDNAATSFPKPRSVVEEMRRFMLYEGGNSGRSAHPLAMAASSRVFDCRVRLAQMFDTEPEQVIFTMNTTYALNMCIKGLLCPGDHVLISDLEHNAVFRPIYRLATDGIIQYDLFPSMVSCSNRTPVRICAGIAKRLTPNTKMLICTGSCNICSVNMPLAEIGSFCRRHGIIFVVDGAQCAGHMKISMEKMCIDALAIPAHKGLLGPQGCGALLLRKGIKLDTIMEGGNGVASLEGGMPDYPPERYESGTLPLPAIAGFSEALRIVEELGEEAIADHEARLYRQTAERLCDIKGVELYAPLHTGGVLLFNIKGKSSEATAAELSEYGICTRGGYHCNGLAHNTLGTPKGGAVRVSFGAFNSTDHIDALCQEVKRMSKA